MAFIANETLLIVDVKIEPNEIVVNFPLLKLIITNLCNLFKKDGTFSLSLKSIILTVIFHSRFVLPFPNVH